MTTNMQGKSLAQMVNEAQAAVAQSASEGEGNNSFSLGEDFGEGDLDPNFSSDISSRFPLELDSKKALQREQNRIEKEIKDFEEHLWATPVDSVALARQDSIAAAEAASKKTKKVSTRTTARQTTTKTEKTKKEKSPSSSGSAPRVSVRRERH